MTPQDDLLIAARAARVMRRMPPPLQELVAVAARRLGYTSTRYAAWVIWGAYALQEIDPTEAARRRLSTIVVEAALYDLARDQ